MISSYQFSCFLETNLCYYYIIFKTLVMSNKSDKFSTVSRSNKRDVLLALGVIATGAAFYNKDAIHSKLIKKGPNEIEYDHLGNAMHLVSGNQLQSLVQNKFLTAHQLEVESLVD